MLLQWRATPIRKNTRVMSWSSHAVCVYAACMSPCSRSLAPPFTKKPLLLPTGLLPWSTCILLNENNVRFATSIIQVNWHLVSKRIRALHCRGHWFTHESAMGFSAPSQSFFLCTIACFGSCLSPSQPPSCLVGTETAPKTPPLGSGPNQVCLASKIVTQSRMRMFSQGRQTDRQIGR